MKKSRLFMFKHRTEDGRTPIPGPLNLKGKRLRGMAINVCLPSSGEGFCMEPG